MCRVRGPRSPNYSHGTAGIARRWRRGTALDRPEPGRGRGPGRPAPAGHGLAGRRRVRRPAHHPALQARGRAGDLHLVPRARRDIPAVRGAVARRRGGGDGVGRGGAAPALPAVDPRLRRSATAAPRVLGQRRPLLRHSRRRRRAARRGPGRAGPASPAGCWRPPGKWGTRLRRTRDPRRRPEHSGGSSSIARTRRSCPRERRGCRALPGSPRSFSASHASSRRGGRFGGRPTGRMVGSAGPAAALRAPGCGDASRVTPSGSSSMCSATSRRSSGDRPHRPDERPIRATAAHLSKGSRCACSTPVSRPGGFA